MSKQKLDKVFKNGSNLKLREIDFENPEFDEIVNAVEEEKIRARNQKRSRPNPHKFVD